MIIKNSHYYRKSDKKYIQRFKCKECGMSFSTATFSKEYRQKKRNLNNTIFVLYCSGISINRLSLILKTSNNTILKKIAFLAELKREENIADLENLKALGKCIDASQFDELLTYIQTKCKPLSLALAVQKNGRKILGYEVSKTPAVGKLAAISREKYGRRPNEERKGLKNLFNSITPYLSDEVLIESDQKTAYRSIVCKVLTANNIKHDYIQYAGRQSKHDGLGELKSGDLYNSNGLDDAEEKVIINGKIKWVKHNKNFDPLFSINHTFAMLRANINRLFRKTWCTTKKIENLKNHLDLYINYHNRYLT